MTDLMEVACCRWHRWYLTIVAPLRMRKLSNSTREQDPLYRTYDRTCSA